MFYKISDEKLSRLFKYILGEKDDEVQAFNISVDWFVFNKHKSFFTRSELLHFRMLRTVKYGRLSGN